MGRAQVSDRVSFQSTSYKFMSASLLVIMCLCEIFLSLRVKSKGIFLRSYSVTSSQQGFRFIMKNSISDFHFSYLLLLRDSQSQLITQSVSALMWKFRLWSIDGMKSTVILSRRNPVDVFWLDAVKTVTLWWNARVGPVNYPAYACHTR